MSSMLVVALTATTRRLPARAAPSAIASSPSGWTARWRPIGPIITGAAIGAPRTRRRGADRGHVDEDARAQPSSAGRPLRYRDAKPVAGTGTDPFVGRRADNIAGDLAVSRAAQGVPRADRSSGRTLGSASIPRSPDGRACREHVDCQQSRFCVAGESSRRRGLNGETRERPGEPPTRRAASPPSRGPARAPRPGS